MTDTSALVAAVAALAVGTLALRLTGPWLHRRADLSPRLQALSTASVAVVLAALIATSTLIEDHDFAGLARLAGVSVAGLLAWRRAPFLGVVLAAAAVTAGLRALGVS